ncbi:MAG: xanthine dehydrogenase family protein molybdopterin-binding subunit [Armatimonadota bacterium]|nr:xanthine dehydrogenase family protein molybdopterin-binding subunit [Armatimonadota bacterium]
MTGLAGTNPFMGRPLRRREDPRLLRGEGRYLSDIALPDMLDLAIIRSPHAHARLIRVETAAARAAPGVATVVSGMDLAVGSIEPVFSGDGYHGAAQPPLARDRVRFVGEPVAVVAAGNRYLAEDAADLVEVAYEPLPAVISAEAARKPDAPLIHDSVPSNCFFRYDHAYGDVASAFAAAPVVVRGTFRHQRLAGAPMEGRGIVAAWDHDRLTVWASTQTPHMLRTGLARSLGIPEDAIRVVVPDVGGGFGPKMHLYPEDLVACALARTIGRPVRWIEDRRENLLAMTQAREQVVNAALAADRDGRILALQADVTCDSGAYSVYPITAALEPMGSAQILPGPYRVPAYAYTTQAIATNKCPVGAYRGVGMTVGVFVMERLMDRLAAAVGSDPAEIRRRNLIPDDAFPYTAPTGLVYDSGRYGDTLEAALAAFGYAEARREQARAREQGRLVGVGVAAFVEYTGMGPATFARRGMRDVPGSDSAYITVDEAGRARVLLSCPSQGQGHETVFAQLAAGELGLEFEAVTVSAVDTDTVGAGSGTFGSRAVVSGGGAVVRAARAVRAKAIDVAAHLLEAPRDDVVIADGWFHVRGSLGRGLSWPEVARAAHTPGLLPHDMEPGLQAAFTYNPPPAAFGSGVHVSLVEVDRETGLIKVLRYAIAEDCGPMINPLLVEGQTHGGLAQGLGEAFLEEVCYDESGQVLTQTLMDYLIPTAVDMPPVTLAHLETPSPTTVHGVKGVGESATIGAPACLANAVSDALGQDADTLPVTPQRILAWSRQRAFREAGV